MKEQRLIKFLAICALVFIPAVVALIGFSVVHYEKSKLEHALVQIENERVGALKYSIMSKVNNMVDLAAYRKSIIKKELHQHIKQRVDDAQKIALSLQEHYQYKKSEQELKQLIVEALRPLEWNNGESFIWILDFDGIFKLAPTYLRHLEGSSIIDFQDSTGREIIKEEIALVKTVGSGFLWDTFTKPNKDPNKQFKQLAFVKKFSRYDWYFGSGEYLDTATKATDQRLLESIEKVDSNGMSDYFFIINTQGKVLLNNASPALVDQNIAESGDEKLKVVFQKILKSSNQKDFIEYDWFNPKNGLWEIKQTYVKSVPGSNWIIGSGFHPAEISRQLVPQKQKLIDAHKEKIDELSRIYLWVLLCSILLSALLSWKIYHLLLKYRQKVLDQNGELSQLNNQLELKVLERTTALEKANLDLKVLATIDSLTGIYNRYAGMKGFHEEFNRALRFKETFSVIIFDIDDFKNVNDKYGHGAGDAVLVELVNLINKSMRNVDVFCRFGGEEFLIVLPQADLVMAIEIAERLREAVTSYDFKEVGSVTISLGVVEYQENRTIDELVNLADIALYEAKNSGRNRVCVSH